MQNWNLQYCTYNWFLGSEQEEFTCAATNVKKNGEFVWSIDGVKQTNSLTDYQDSSSKYETKLEHTFVIDLTKMSDPIAELNKKNLVCRYSSLGFGVSICVNLALVEISVTWTSKKL